MKFFNFRLTLASIAVPLMACLHIYGGVEWDASELKSEALIGSSAVQFTFAFKNGGSLPVEFDAPSAGCGCTLAKLDKAVYAPGESGVLKGTYSTSGRHGLNKAKITVKGDEVDGDMRRPFSDTLTFSVTIPEIVKISPGIALWRKDSESVTAKTIRFEVNESLSLPLTLASINKDTFAGEWTTIAEGKIYELKATPTSTAESGQAMVTVEGINKEGKTLRFHAHLMIR